MCDLVKMLCATHSGEGKGYKIRVGCALAGRDVYMTYLGWEVCVAQWMGRSECVTPKWGNAYDVL